MRMSLMPSLAKKRFSNEIGRFGSECIVIELEDGDWISRVVEVHVLYIAFVTDVYSTNPDEFPRSNLLQPSFING